MGTFAKIVIGLLIAFVVLAGAGLLFSARPTPILRVDGESLAHSVDEAQSICEQRPDGGWNCLVTDGFRPADYEVDVRWDGCWKATLSTGSVRSTRGPEEITGCVDVWDHLRLESLLD